MFHLKKFTCSVLAALAIGNSVLSLPADTSNMSNNVVNAMAANAETERKPLQYAVCTKNMATRSDHKSDSKFMGYILAGSIIDLTSLKDGDVWVSKNGKNIWVKHFYVTDARTQLVNYYNNDAWVCISNSSIVSPDHISKKIKFSIYSKPDTKFKITDIEARNIDGRPQVKITNIQRINNDNWGRISYLNVRTNKLTKGYVLMADFEELNLECDKFNNEWVKKWKENLNKK